MTSQNTASANPKSQFSNQNTVLWSGKDLPLQNDISYALLALKVFTATSYAYACPTVLTVCMANKLAPLRTRNSNFTNPLPTRACITPGGMIVSIYQPNLFKVNTSNYPFHAGYWHSTSETRLSKFWHAERTYGILNNWSCRNDKWLTFISLKRNETYHEHFK